jgi:hypothetical protein
MTRCEKQCPGQGKAAGVSSDLSDLDLRAWIGALSAALAGTITQDQILSWGRRTAASLLPVPAFLGAYGRLSGERIRMRNVVTSGHQPACIASLEDAFDLTSRGCFAWWVQKPRGRMPAILRHRERTR